MDAFRVIAIISSFNEGDIISPIIRHLVDNGVDVYLIDNQSTDDTIEQARPWLGRGLINIEIFPQHQSADAGTVGFFDWSAILRRKEELAFELSADWFIHHDADEVRESPWPGFTLKEAICWVDSLGYNCINFTVLNFPPVDDGFTRGADPRSYFIGFEDVRHFDQVQLKCWKVGKSPVNLVSSGGHEVRFEGRRVCPIPFLLRHYPIRGQTHGARKVFRERKGRFFEIERSRGWHVQYDQIRDENYCFLKDPASLTPFNLARARLELMLPEKLLRDLADRLFKTEETLDKFRAQKSQLKRKLNERRDTLNLQQAPNQREPKVAILQTQEDELKHYAAEIKRERDEICSRMENLETWRQELSQHCRTLEQELAAIRNSRSWRWTASLRRLFDFVAGSLR